MAEIGPNPDISVLLAKHRILWRQTGLMPCFHQCCSQRGRDPNGIAVSARTEGWLQHKHLPGGGFGFRYSPEFGKRRRQEALGHAEAWIGQDGSPGGGCRFLVVPKYEIADGYGLVTPKGKPV